MSKNITTNKPLPIAIITSHGFRGKGVYPGSPLKNNQLELFLINLIQRFSNNEYTFEAIEKKINVHSPEKTALAIDEILQTRFESGKEYFINYSYINGEKENSPWIKYKYGSNGGIVQIATKCVKNEIYAVFLLLDPDDKNSNSPENRALSRICIRKKIPLLTSLRSATEWFSEQFEETKMKYREEIRKKESEKTNTPFYKKDKDDFIEFKEGFPSNEKIISSPRIQTIALISHDEMKIEMIRFVENYPDVISSFYRILATGTTGWLIKTLFANEEFRSKFLKDAKNKLGDDRYQDFIETSNKIQKELWLGGFPRPRPELVKKIYPLESGPDGGDIRIANEVLDKKCDYIIFTQDPMHAHPHEPDINLLQRTCQITDHNSVCISDRDSAEKWAKEKQKIWRLNE